MREIAPGFQPFRPVAIANLPARIKRQDFHSRRTGRNGVSDYFSRYDEFDAAILLPAADRVVGSDWLCLAESARRHGRRGNALLTEVVSHRTGAIF
jgi:hypothetical protein